MESGAVCYVHLNQLFLDVTLLLLPAHHQTQHDVQLDLHLCPSVNNSMLIIDYPSKTSNTFPETIYLQSFKYSTHRKLRNSLKGHKLSLNNSQLCYDFNDVAIKTCSH